MLLTGDGHIKLADMGGVAEFAEGTCLETTKVREADRRVGGKVDGQRTSDFCREARGVSYGCHNT